VQVNFVVPMTLEEESFDVGKTYIVYSTVASVPLIPEHT
jgi:hypothetical protein